MTENLETKIIEFGQKRLFHELGIFIKNLEHNKLKECVLKKINRPDFLLLWNYILIGSSATEESLEKKFIIVMTVLNELKRIKLTTKQSFDIVAKIFTHLPSFTSNQLIEICEYCVDCIRTGDPNCVSWKDLFPEVIIILKGMQKLNVNEIQMTGDEFRQNTVTSLITMKWTKDVLVPLASMFKDFPITVEERTKILRRFCENFTKLDPLELPPLSFQLFSLCSNSSLVLIPILEFEKYFHKYYYKKLYVDMFSDTTDYDSVDQHSEKEFREAEETVLYHLGSCTEYRMTESEIVNVFKGIQSTPQFILTPFVISAILTMCNLNRYPETSRLSSSLILPFLKNVLKNNENEKKMIKESAWCRLTIEYTECIDFDKILNILIDQNRDGNDVVTPGIVALAFVLLKTKHNSEINTMAVTFLQKFLKKRFIFGQGILKKLSEFLFADQDAGQYAECLTTLALTNSLTVSECIETINSILDYMLLIPGLKAMKMMSFIFPLVKISHVIRDSLIEMLRKAMYHRDLSTRMVGVYGFCMLLKQLKNSNSRRNTNITGSLNFSQTNTISGFSLVSQTMGNMDSPNRHLDLLTLEIVGILRKSFDQSKEIKVLLYECLLRAIEFNSTIIPHILQFIDLHFRSYFNIDEIVFEIKFEKIIIENTNGTIIENDSLGNLIFFTGMAIYLCDQNCVNYDNLLLKDLFTSLIDRIDVISLEHLGFDGLFNLKLLKIGTQFLNSIEALMSYCIWMSKQDNNLISKCLNLFKYHEDCYEKIKIKTTNKKVKKKSSNDTTNVSATLIPQAATLPINFKPDNIWDVATMERFLNIIFNDSVSFASIEQTNPMKTNREFGQYVLKVTITKVSELRSEPEYKHITHSRRMFNLISQISKTLYKNCLQRLSDLCVNYNELTGKMCVECFKEILLIVDLLFKRKLNEFLIATTENKDNNKVDNCYNLIEILQGLLETCIAVDAEIEDPQIPTFLLECLEILYRYVPGDHKFALQIYNWLYNICETNKIETKNLFLMNKLLFNQRVKTQPGIFFNSVAKKIQKEVGQIEEESCDLEFNLKSINLFTYESATLYLCTILNNQIDECGYFITKAKSFYCKLKITTENALDAQECLQSMKNIERSISSQLIYISKTVIPLANSQLPPGVLTNTLVRVLTNLYICITNLTKHLIQRHSTIHVSFQTTKFDQLVRSAGKPLATKVYGLITYIDEHILPEEGSDRKKKNNPQINKTKILIGTKFLPRLILCLENFNKFVIVLSKKTKTDLSSHLHIGTVRDFRIKTSDLLQAIESNENDEENVSSDDVNLDEEENIEDKDNSDESLVHNENEEEENEVVEEETTVQPERRTRSSGVNKSTPDNPTEILARNIKKVNKIGNSKTKKKEKTNVNIEIPEEYNSETNLKSRKRKGDNEQKTKSTENKKKLRSKN